MKRHILVVFLTLIFATQVWCQEYPDSTVIILDASGSMNQSMRDKDGNRIVKMVAAKDALMFIIDQLQPNEFIGLLQFSAKGRTENWLYPIAPIDRGKLFAAIQKPEPNGGTPLGEYMKKGADALLAHREAQFGYGKYRLLIVTDGEATDDRVVRRFTPDILSRGITVDVIGVDMNHDHILATQAHTYRTASNPEELRRALQSVFAEVGGDPDVPIEEVYASVAALPEIVVEQAVFTLMNTGNHPIGDKPPVRRLSAQSNAPPSGQAVPNNLPTSSGGSIMLTVLGIIVAIVLLFIVVAIILR